MAISFVGGATAVSTGNTDVSVSLTALTGGSDSAPSTNDLIIFAYNIADADNADLNLACNTTGFVELADLFGNGTQDANLGVYWKLHDGDTAVVGEGSLGGTDTSIQGVVLVFRGVDTTTPFDVTLTTATGTTTGNADPPSIDHTGAAGVWTVIIGANAHAANANGTFTAPTNYTTDFFTVGNQDTADGIIGAGYRTNPADPENPGAMTSSATATGWCAATLALRPASAVVHAASGAVSAQSATTSGAASRTRVHAASGAVSAQSATVAASASRVVTVSHDASGSVTAGSATASGQAKRYLPHAATGAISAAAATISGVAKRYAIHDATGAVEAGSATVSSAASRGGVVTHDATATLIAQNATISAEASGPASVAVDRPIPVGHINKHNRERFHSRAALALSRKQASLQRSVKSIENKLAKTKGKPPEGILAKYWEVQNKMDELESKMFLLEFGDFKMPDFDNEDDDIQALL